MAPRTFLVWALGVVAACSGAPTTLPPGRSDAATDARMDARSDVPVTPDTTPVGMDAAPDGPSGDTAATDTQVTLDSAPMADSLARETTADARDEDADRCEAGVDSDGDGLTNEEECRLGTDPTRRDSDSDGITDGIELLYPRVCAAVVRDRQRRPPVACRMDSECMMGERCAGLNPLNPDTDADGVADGLEDRNLDGRIDTRHGETDPRIADTDGDGLGDGMSGVSICRPAGLATVTQLGLPGANVQAGYDPRWGTARRVTGTMGRSGVVLEDPAVDAAAAVFALTSMGDVRAEAARAEAALTAGLGAGAALVLGGRSFRTHEGNDAVASTYRVARATTATALRDAVAASMLGTAPPAAPAPAGASSDFVVEIATVRRTVGASAGVTDVIVGVAPRAVFDDVTRTTALRVNDLVNATGVAQLDRGLGAHCQVFRADRTAQADFLWTVDISGSMGPYQMRLGATARAFFERLRTAGVDFRVGVVAAGEAMLNLDSPGFRWISGTDPMGAQTLCEQVTSASLGRCPTSPTDTLSPYPFSGGSEEPTAAAVVAFDTFNRRGMMGETNPDRRFRAGARVVTFHVTDEPGSNDFGRYFSSRMDPQTGTPWGSTWNAATLGNIVGFFRRNGILTFGLLPLRPTSPCDRFDVYDLPRCVVEGNGGAVIPIATATDAEVGAAMMRIVDAIAGASSQFVLERIPITSTLQVRVRGMAVPRSRDQGFDYDGSAGAVVFYGTRYRPNAGDEVVVSFRVWQPCPVTGAVCTVDADCCAPHRCIERRCRPPCRPLGETCAMDSECCTPYLCLAGRCQPPVTCRPPGAECAASGDCCAPDVCTMGRCGPPPPCRRTDEACAMDADCCGGSCRMGRCACVPISGRCTTPADCCSRACFEGFCGPG
ncbi:MAG: hypothetical protein HY909_06030 [Deltaproteobacteria bacterium]|nr:hypothetical protein [Deltaproteobacteria bacterium]